MSSQLNPIVANLRPQTWNLNRPQFHRFPSQGYPPNVSASLRAPKLLSPSSILVIATVIEPLSISNDVEEFEGGISYQFIEEPILAKEFKIENPLTRMSEAVVSEIDALMAGREDETKPTEFAYSKARAIIESAYGKAFGRAKVPWSVPEIVQTPVATTDDTGGIRLLWHEGAKQIRLNFGADENRRSYLYFEEDLPQGITHDVEPLDPDHLAERLAWLMGK